jgi:hypothetical protein
VVWQHEGDISSPKYRTQILRVGPVIGDLDGDGYQDSVHDVQRFTITRPGFYGIDSLIEVLSGRDGATMRVFRVQNPPGGIIWTTHCVAPVGDMDGDATADYAVAMHNSGTAPQRLHIRSGRDDSMILDLVGPLYGSTWGKAILGNMNLDGDSRPDFVLSEYAWGQAFTIGRILAYSNAGKLLYMIEGDQALRYLHGSQRCLGRIGDVDADGRDDFGIGVIDYSASSGGVAVFSGRTGRRLYVATEPAYRRHAIGHQVLGCGDWDADGVPDFVASTLYGVMIAFSGVNGRVIRTWTPEQDGVDGSALAVGDVDRDGMLDPIVKGVELAGVVRAFSGRDGQLLFTMTSDHPQSGPYYGVWLDVQRAAADGFLRVHMTDWGYGSTWWAEMGVSRERGRALVQRSVPASVSVEGRACAVRLVREPRIGFRRAEQGVRVHLSDAPAGSPAFLLVGVSRDHFGAHRLPLDLGSLGYNGCTLYTSADLALPVTVGATGTARGYAYADVPLRFGEGQGTIPLYAQWKVWDVASGGAGLSEMLTWTVRL